MAVSCHSNTGSVVQYCSPYSWHHALLAAPIRLQGEETHHVAVIMSNPEQSKHLETARMKVRPGMGGWRAQGHVPACLPA